MEMESGFRITLFSHPDYENLTAEIYLRDQFIALVSRENDAFSLEFSSTDDILGQQLDLLAFVEALGEARNRLNSKAI